jgi:hypothetical protein
MRHLLPLVLLIGLAACGQEPLDPHAGHDHAADDHSGEDHSADDHSADDHSGDDHSGHEHSESASDEHLHEAPRGGTLVVLREEGAHVEVLADMATGHVSVLVLGPHGAQPVRIVQKAISVTFDVAGEPQTVELPAIASELSGETVGDTSEFAALVPALKGVGTFSGSIASVTVRGETYTDLAFTYP